MKVTFCRDDGWFDFNYITSLICRHFFMYHLTVHTLLMRSHQSKMDGLLETDPEI